MALTRRMLTALGIEPDKIDQIIESHTETVEGLKNEAADLREKAAKAEDLEKKVEELEAARPKEDWETKYGELNTEFEAYKAHVSAEKAKAEKARLYRAILAEAGIDQKRLDAIMRVTDLDGIEVADGKIADEEAVRARVAEEWAAFIPQIEERGAQVATPPQTSATDHGANPEVMARLKERHERMYGKTEE